MQKLYRVVEIHENGFAVLTQSESRGAIEGAARRYRAECPDLEIVVEKAA